MGFPIHVALMCVWYVYRFWSLLEQYCYPKGVAGIPLVTSFGRGYGRFLAIDGEAVMRSDWTNHSSMDVQPTFNSDILQLGSKVQAH